VSRSGKTNLMMRLWAGWYAAALAAVTTGGAPRPLLAALDCKGGPDARVKAGRTRRLLHGVGARRVAIWPDEARLSLWVLPPADLSVLLFQMIETGDGAAAYYGDMLQAAVSLALAAPGGPPANAAAFVDRLDAHWLEAAYGDGLHDAVISRIRAAKPHLGDIQLRYATLLGRLGPALDGPAVQPGQTPGHYPRHPDRRHSPGRPRLAQRPPRRPQHPVSIRPRPQEHVAHLTGDTGSSPRASTGSFR
jgi:hypothetical protein